MDIREANLVEALRQGQITWFQYFELYKLLK